MLAFSRRFAGDSAGAKVAAEQARDTLEPLCTNEPDDSTLAGLLSLSYAILGNKDLATKQAERAIMLLPRVKDAVNGPDLEENLAFIQANFGENGRAISTLTQLLQTPYYSDCYAPTALRRPFSGSTLTGILCAAIPLSKSSARKSSRKDTNCTNYHEWADQLV